VAKIRLKIRRPAFPFFWSFVMDHSKSEPFDPMALASDIVSAFVGYNSLPSTELPALIQSVHAALTAIASGSAAPSVTEPMALTPATPIRKSVTPDYIVCLDDGRKFKSLRRHLALLGMTPDAYRQKWKLPADYPMVAPNYAAARSALAKKIGLGQYRQTAAAPKAKAAAKGKPGRPRKVAAAG
jgi:predicted transcriptional regulator